ncbi:MAG: hypothetical protein K2Y32_00195 [Candidatus Obscuribacterales bacterium]|nr:hypothetical protein [Candidatus Obscuribacterales bacterium]
MATTKKCIKFYAEADVEAFIDAIPASTRSTWLNQLVRAAMEEKESGAPSELSKLKDFLRAKKKAPPLYSALADLLDDFSVS